MGKLTSMREARTSTDAIAEACRRVLLIGESNPYGGPEENALVPWPEHCAGHRLQKILGLDEPTYLMLGRRNLLHRNALRGRTWAAADARYEAREILNAHEGHTLVLLGRKVTAAFEKIFGRSPAPFTCTIPLNIGSKHATPIIVLPHPSGRNAAVWARPASIPRARDLLAEVAPLVPWGSHP